LSIRTFTQPTEARKITAKVDTFEGDFGTISLLPSLFNAKDQDEATQIRRGYLLDPNMLELRYGRRPRFQELEDQGGGPRGLIDAICALVCWNPKSLGKFSSTS
jgi:hypothetical protein